MKYNKAKLVAIGFFYLGLSGCHTNSVSDIDGNKYKTVKIGNQVWMAEDLKTTRYNDGTKIPLVTDYDNWAKLNSDGFCWYNNDSTFKNSNGALYNWYAVNTGKLCPKGWHVPTEVEWMTLGSFVGGPFVAGGKLKEIGYDHWKSPNTKATNEFGFTALPGGFRSYNGAFNFIGKSAYWWSSKEYTKNAVYFYSMRYKFSDMYKNVANKPNGFCVRCLLNK